MRTKLLICFNQIQVRLYRKSGSFGEVKMGHLILMGAKKANSGPSKNPSLGLVEVNSD